MTEPILQVEHLTKRFGGVTAVEDVSFEVFPGEIVAVIGPNGAGKTTLFNMITCFIPPTEGNVKLNGENITGKKIFELAPLGMMRTFQNLEVFGSMTALENLMIGISVQLKNRVFAAGLHLKSAREEEQYAYEKAMELIELTGLQGLEHTLVEQMSYGQQKKVEFAQTIISNPQLVLLDEPMAGLNEVETEAMADTILQMRNRGMTFLFVEHKMATIMRIADRIVVLDFGKKIAEGLPAEIQKNEDVIRAYIGGDLDDVKSSEYSH